MDRGKIAALNGIGELMDVIEERKGESFSEAGLGIQAGLWLLVWEQVYPQVVEDLRCRLLLLREGQ